MQHQNFEKYTQIVDYINDFYEEYHFPPAINDIAEGVQMSRSTLGRYLQTMERDGLIEHHSRGKYITPQQRNQKGTNVPIVGKIACGEPIFAEENIEEYVNLPRNVFGDGKLFILYAKGDSMINAGINDGDMVVIRNQNTARPGEIVVALVNDEATLKRFYPEKNRVRLHPENDNMEDFYVDKCDIQGVAMSIIRRIK